MLYIAEIELLNFVQLKGKKYHRFYDPFFSYVFIGPNGSGKSSVMAEHDPRPMVHGYTTILKGFEGMKKIIFRDTTDPSYGLKVIHYYTPKKEKKEDEKKNVLKMDFSRHTVSSFLYELHYDDVVNTMVNGQTSQFKEMCPKYFGLTYDAIPITTIGVKFGRNTFNLMSCNDIDRYNYLKMVLKSVDDVKRLEDIIVSKSQVINRRIKDYKSIISSISQMDFDNEIQKLELDIKDYNTQKNIHNERKTRLGIEYDSISDISMYDRDAYIQEYKDLKLIEEAVGSDSYLQEYKELQDRFKTLYAEKQYLLKLISQVNHDIIEINSSNPANKRFEIDCLKEDIAVISANLEDIDFDVDVLDKAQNNLQAIHNLISKITMYPDIIFSDVDFYKNSLEIQSDVSKTQRLLQELYNRKSDIQAETITDNEREFFIEGNVPYTNNCNGCSMYKRRVEVESKIIQLEKNSKEIESIYTKIEEYNVTLNRLERIQSLFSHMVDFRNTVDSLDDTVLDNIVFNKTCAFFFHNISELEDRVKTMKYNAMNHMRLRDMTNKLNILLQDNSMEKLEDLTSRMNDYKQKVGTIDVELDEINSFKLFSIPEEIAYKYVSIDRSKRIDELSEIISNLSSISEKSKEIEKEISDLDRALITLDSILERKASELMKIQIEKARFEENTTNYKNELMRSKKADKLKTLLSKQIPTIFLELYMIYVKDEANIFLEDTGRYSLDLPKINYDEDTKRNTFIIPILDNGELKSCSVLSKGEDNIISIAVTLPLIYIASDIYRIARMDEMDSTLDINMKKLQMDKMMNFDRDKLSQLLMVSHSSRDFFDAYDRCRVIDLAII